MVRVRLLGVIAPLAGGTVAVSGAIVQAVTTNLPTSAGLLGMIAGAAFVVMFVMTFFGIGVGGLNIRYLFLSSAIAAIVFYTVGLLSVLDNSVLDFVLINQLLSLCLGYLGSAWLFLLQPVRRPSPPSAILATSSRRWSGLPTASMMPLWPRSDYFLCAWLRWSWPGSSHYANWTKSSPAMRPPEDSATRLTACAI